MKPVRWVVLFLTLLTTGSFAPAWQNATAPKSVPSKTVAPKVASSGPAVIVDVNHATKDELKTLPGIGDAYANAIVRNRPYKNKTQLLSRNVLPDATYKKIKDKIIAKQ